ncbi:deoxyribodipyrimidine photo-lyase [Ferrimonas gelatinilytica]|uniref:Deoxyribodipyrimidine photo-lyase n=1 Tax=Ferrimonas gelatinilytica TaxID=1255257 RepID=A0ABP9RZ89_9GAMM
MKAVWFRSDLRLEDNPALDGACEVGQPIRGIYFATPGQWRRHGLGPNKLGWIRANLESLKQRLAESGVALDILQVDDFDAIPNALLSWCEDHLVDQVFCNAEPGFNEERRDTGVANCLNEKGLKLHRFAETNLLDFDAIETTTGTPYRVFTPFSRKAREYLSDHTPAPLTFSKLDQPSSDGDSGCDEWEQEPDYPGHLIPGEAEAQMRLKAFLDEKVDSYHEARNVPADEGTSYLSPYLAVGVLSVRTVFAALQQQECDGEGASTWLNELLWREFYRYLMYHFPSLSKDSAMYPEKEPEWEVHNERFQRWQQGETGFEMVDAGMKQLLQTGWMHNRLRMLCASFLVKDLHLDWRLGERHFMYYLLDGDFPSNNGGWQWAAGCGADAAPYYRHFSPSRQAERFDSDRRYRDAFLPKNTTSRDPIVDHALQSKSFNEKIKELRDVS